MTSRPVLPSSGRRVRFLDPDTNAIMSPAALTPPVIPFSPLTPSPTYSDSSLPSVGLLTPPSFPQYLPPIRAVGNAIQVHPAIAALNFDILNSPSRVPPTPSSHRSRSPLPTSPIHFGFEPAVFDEPATYPPLPALTFVSDLLPWSIHVEASASLSVPVVTVYDVLQTLHINLRIQIAPCEWANVPPATQQMITASFYARVDSLRDTSQREAQWGKGVRRLDFLCGKTRLVGLNPLPDKLDVLAITWGLAL